MDKIIETPVISGELKELVEKAKVAYKNNFNSNTWFGRCIFLSWYCERGTCDFCFRSTQKHKIENPVTARRSIPSVIAEAAMIRGFGWHLEFLTGGYGIYPFEEILRITKICSQVLGRKMWINLGVIEPEQLLMLKPYVEGIVSSLETLEPVLHKKVCPDKPIEPYLEMVKTAKEMGFKQSFTLVIGLNEKKEDYSYVHDLISTYKFERVTVYALRPVNGTPYTHGPDPLDLAWWIAKIRTEFPTIEIIAGSAIYRIPEISLLLDAGANAFTKLPATNLFNTSDADKIYSEVEKSGRNLTSIFKCSNLRELCDWEAIINNTDLTELEKEESIKALYMYLDNMQKKLKNNK
ncbi:radical SAM protein [Candidatus Woesearchaeota archaeon]|nr:radical SAM protein [Candidatus Woesearchaeota archaeon]